MKYYKFFTLILLIGISVNSYSQSKRSEKAFYIFNVGEYTEAIDLFKRAYQDITDKKEKLNIAFHIAECYRITDKPKSAALWYGKVVAKNYENPVAILHYANMLKKIEEYDEAKIQFEKYKGLVTGDPRGEDGIISCDLALEWKENPNGYEVEEMKFFNSKFSDYSPCYAKEDYREVYFTSTRDETIGKSEHGGTGEGFADIFVSSMDRKGKWSIPAPLGNEINTEFEEGTPIVSGDYSRLYFTRCQASKKKAFGCEIFVANRSGDEWGKITSLGILSDSLVIAHPAISPDELTLYFVSDINGSIKNTEGKNSKDIWKVTRSGIESEWSEPVNLGEPVNTQGDELFPFMHNDGTLYFSSDGHIGMGGLDIFKAKQNTKREWEIENMRYPINSSADDFGICFQNEHESGYFSSSRKEKGDDIYAFVLPPLKFSITGVVKNEKTDEPIINAKIKSISSDGVTLEQNTLTDGTFKFMLNPGADYVFLASKEGFLQGKERETTKGIDKSTEFRTVIYIPPIDQPIELENIFFDFNSAELRPESMVALDKLVETLNDNSTITIELGSHTDSRASDEYNLNLSVQRAQSVVNYLIEKGIVRDRLIPKGYGESKPKVVDKKDNSAYPFLPEGKLLTEVFINTLEDEGQREIAHSLNRRTEFMVLTTDYK